MNTFNDLIHQLINQFNLLIRDVYVNMSTSCRTSSILGFLAPRAPFRRLDLIQRSCSLTFSSPLVL
jgi:hypothetical protein